MTLIWLLFIGFLLGLAFLIWFFHKRLIEPFAQPLSEYDTETCKKIIKEKDAYFLLCRWSVRHRKCICLPCKKLEAYKNRRAG